MIILSILIPTIPSRKEMVEVLKTELLKQIYESDHFNKVELYSLEDDGSMTTGGKRNEMLDSAKGKYVAFFDDDDWPEPTYISSIMEALKEEPDVVGFNGYITFDGKNRTPWMISKEFPYKTIAAGKNKMFLRFNNHLSPIKKEIALQIKFPEIYNGEDYDYAVRLRDSGLIKTEVYLNIELYHYRYITKK